MKTCGKTVHRCENCEELFCSECDDSITCKYEHLHCSDDCASECEQLIEDNKMDEYLTNLSINR